MPSDSSLSELAASVGQEAASITEELESRDEGVEPLAPLTAAEAVGLPIELDEAGVGEEEAIRRLREVVLATPPTTGPRFANQLFAGRDRVATLAEVLTAVLNTSMYTFKAAGVQALIEREVITRMLDKAGMGGGDGMFAPGGSLSNLAAMIVGRNEVVGGALEDGFDGRKRRIYISEESHYSISKNTNMIGVGRGNLVSVAADDAGRMDPTALVAAIERDAADGKEPMMIVATSGTTVLGAFDPLEELADIGRRFGLWLHVDGAFGGSALMHPEHRSLMAGIERADSLTWDAHKMMGVPLTCSVALTRGHGLMYKHFNETATYLFQEPEDAEPGLGNFVGPWRNPGVKSLQCGRRNDALKLWAQWQAIGDTGYADRIDRQLELAAYLTQRVREEESLRLSVEPAWINVCFEVEGKPTGELVDTLNARGLLKVSSSIVKGRRVLRMVTVNPDHTTEDIDRMIGDVLDVAAELPSGDNAVGG